MIQTLDDALLRHVFDVPLWAAVLGILSDHPDGVHVSEISRLLGLSDRLVRKCVEGLRRAGVVICSDEAGYWLPSNTAELRRYVRKEERRGRSGFFTLQSARKLLAEVENDGKA